MEETSLTDSFHGFPSDSFTPCRLEIKTKGTGEEEQLVSVRRSTGKEMSLQTKSSWLGNFQTLPISEEVNMISRDGVSVLIPQPVLVASSDFMQSLLFSHCITNTIYLPSSTGCTLKLFSQILLGGETVQIQGDDVESCLENVKDVFDLLGFEVDVESRISCDRIDGQDSVVRSHGEASCLNPEIHVVIQKEEESKGSSRQEIVQEEQGRSYGLNLMGCKEEDTCHEGSEYFEYGDFDNVNKLKEQHDSDNFTPDEADSKIEIKLDIVKAETDCKEIKSGQSPSLSYKYHFSSQTTSNSPDQKNTSVSMSSFSDASFPSSDQAMSSSPITVSSPDRELIKDFDNAKTDIIGNKVNEKIDKNSNTMFFHMDDIDDIIEDNIIDDAKNASFSTTSVNPCHVMIPRLTQVDDYMVNESEKQNHAEDDEHTGPAPTIALVSPHHSTLGLFQKGYYGSYHCLREGCIYVCGTYGTSTQKLLLNHWAKEHGDVKQLLYLDMSSFAIIGLKIIFNHVGSCSYVGCTHMLYGDTVDKFQGCIVEHWHASHPTMDNSYHPRMCQVISQEDLPVLTDQDAADLIRKQGVLNGFRTGYRVSNSWLQDSVEYPFTCSAPGCGELIKSMYGRHFSKLHSDVPLDKIRVTTIDGKIITCEDLFNFALECGLCPKVCAGGQTEKHSSKCMKRHWIKDHPDRAKEEPIFRNIISESSSRTKRPSLFTTSTVMKKQKTDEKKRIVQ